VPFGLSKQIKRLLSFRSGTSNNTQARPNFVFAIPIAGYTSPTQWEHLSELLLRTIRSTLNQGNPHFKVFVAGHERPARLDEITDERVEFIPVEFAKPTTPRGRRQDKTRKRWAIAAHYRKLGGGYFMYLDADDYVHRNLVDHVLTDDNRSGYFIPEGYALDYKNANLAPIPGAWRKPFNHVCGSSGIVYFEPDDLPRKPFPQQWLRKEPYFKIRNHLSFQDVSLREQPNSPIPFPAAIYNVNNALNLSNVIVRTPERQLRLIEGIRKRKIKDDRPILEAFGVEELLPHRDDTDTAD